MPDGDNEEKPDMNLVREACEKNVEAEQYRDQVDKSGGPPRTSIDNRTNRYWQLHLQTKVASENAMIDAYPRLRLQDDAIRRRNSNLLQTEGPTEEKIKEFWRDWKEHFDRINALFEKHCRKPPPPVA